VILDYETPRSRTELLATGENVLDPSESKPLRREILS
jgi:hypothetical protein